MRSTKTRSAFPTVLLLSVMALVLAPPAADAARMLAPLDEMTRAQNRVIVAEVVAKPEPGKLRLRPVETLSGEPATEEFTARVGDAGDASAEAGETRIVAYTTVRKHPLVRDVWEEDPEGPKVLTLPVVGDALFPDRPELRTLVRGYRQAPPPKQQLAGLLPLLDAPESPTRRLALLELYHRPELRAAVDAASVEPLKELLASEELPPLTRDYLLRVTLGLPEKTQGSWMADAARQAIDGNEQPVDLASPIPALLITAVEVVAETGSKKDLDRLRPLLASNSPGVAKATLEALRTLDPEAARAAAKSALEGGKIHAETRRVLDAFLAGGW